jgi:hypothetical protein
MGHIASMWEMRNSLKIIAKEFIKKRILIKLENNIKTTRLITKE